MMQLGELREHYDYKKLVTAVERWVDTSAESVLISSEKDDLPSVRYYAGMHHAMVVLLQDLKGKTDA